MSNFSSDISEWAKTNDEINLLNEKIKHMKKINNEKMNHVLSYIHENNLDKNVFYLDSLDINIKLSEKKVSESISYKYLDDCINKYFDNNKDKPDDYHKENLLNFIKNSRTSKCVYLLKTIKS